MARIAQLGVVINPAGAKKGAQEVKGALGEIETSAQRMTRNLQSAAAALGLAFGTRALIEYADTFTRIEGRLSLVTTSTTQLARVQRELFQIAQDGRQAFEGVAELYGRMARSAGELGLQEAQLLEITETVSLALRVSGTSSAQASGALLQLSQAFGAGVVRAEEFNSVLEGAPRIAQAVADGLGVTVGQLRRNVLEGSVTSAQFAEALRSQLGTLQAESARLPDTVGGALQQLNNSFGALVAGTDDATSASQLLAQTISGTAKFLDENRAAAEALGLALGAAGVALAARQATVALAGVASAQSVAAFGALLVSVRSTRDALVLAQFAARGFWVAVTGPIGLAVAGITAVAGAILLVRKNARDAADETQRLADTVATADERTANLQLAQAEADRVAAVRAAESAVPGIATRRAAAAVAEATERTKAWTDRLRELRQASADAAASTAAGTEAARKAAEEAARTAAAKLAAKEAAEELARAQKFEREALRDAEAGWVQLGIALAAAAAGRAEARTQYDQFTTTQQASIEAVREEITAVLAGGIAMRELALTRAADRAELEARNEALRLGVALTAGDIEQARARGRLLEEETRRLAALAEWRDRIAGGENPFRIDPETPARTADFARGLQDALFAAQGLATAFGEAGREIADLIGSLNTAAQGVGRLREAAAQKDASGASIGLGGVLRGQAGASEALSAVAGLGAVFTGVVGVLRSLTSGAREQAELLKRRTEEFERALQAFTALAAGGANRVVEAIRIAEQQASALRGQTEVPEFFRRRLGPDSSALQAIDAYTTAINDALKANLERIAGDLLTDIERAFNSATGNEAANQLADAQRAYEERVEALGELLARNLITQDQYTAALAQSAEVLAIVTKAIEDAAAAEVARLAAEEAARARAREFNGRDIGLRERALAGEDVTAERLRLDGDRELDAARKLFEAGELTEEMFLRLADVIGGEITAALNAAAEAAARAAQAVQDDLAVRILLAQGDDAGAAAARREIAWRNELIGVTDEGLRAQIEYVQQLEREAIVKDELAAAAEAAAAQEQLRIDQNQSIDERMLRAQGRDAEADALRLQIEREAELRAAVDETTRARLEELYAMEDAAAAAKALTAELEEQARQAQRLADLTFDVNIDLLREQGNDFEADRLAIIAAGEKRRQELIAAGASEETLANLDTLIQLKLDNLVARTLGAGAASLAAGSGERSGVVDAASVRGLGNLTEPSALRLIDVATTQLSVLRGIERNTSGAGGGGVSITVSVQTGMITGTTPRALGQAIAQEIAPIVNESLGRTVGRDRDLTGSARLGDS
jgi:tape measure domain-containing protein